MAVRRLNLTLPVDVYEQLNALAKEDAQSMKEIVRQAFALVKVAHDERKAGNKLAVLSKDNKTIKELVLPH